MVAHHFGKFSEIFFSSIQGPEPFHLIWEKIENPGISQKIDPNPKNPGILVFLDLWFLSRDLESRKNAIPPPPLYQTFEEFSSETMAPKKFTDTVEVTREDQEKINKFSRLNQRLTDVDSAVSGRQKIVKDISDASEIVEELQITDDDAPGSS